MRVKTPAAYTAAGRRRMRLRDSQTSRIQPMRAEGSRTVPMRATAMYAQPRSSRMRALICVPMVCVTKEAVSAEMISPSAPI